MSTPIDTNIPKASELDNALQQCLFRVFVAHVSHVVDHLISHGKYVSSKDVRSYIDRHPPIDWLHKDYGWYRLPQDPNQSIRQRVTKMLNMRELSAVEAYSALSEDQSIARVLPPTSICDLLWSSINYIEKVGDKFQLKFRINENPVVQSDGKRHVRRKQLILNSISLHAHPYFQQISPLKQQNTLQQFRMIRFKEYQLERSC